MGKVFGRLENRVWNELTEDIHRIERLAGKIRASRSRTDMSKNYNGPKLKLFRKSQKRPKDAKNIAYDYLRNDAENSAINMYRLYNQVRFTYLGINRDDLKPKTGR